MKNLLKISFILLSFCLLSLNYLTANYILSYDILSLSLVGIHRGISNSTLDIKDVSQSGLLYSLKNIKEYASISIVSMLEFSAIKEVVLDNFISDTEKILNDTSFIMNDLRQSISILESDMKNCEENKDLYDKQFFESLDFYDIEYMEESLNNSISAEKCVSENRIRMNSKIILLDQFQKNYDFIKMKYDYIVSKRDYIIRNYDFIKNGMLEELVNTKEVLNQIGN